VRYRSPARELWLCSNLRCGGPATVATGSRYSNFHAQPLPRPLAGRGTTNFVAVDQPIRRLDFPIPVGLPILLVLCESRTSSHGKRSLNTTCWVVLQTLDQYGLSHASVEAN